MNYSFPRFTFSLTLIFGITASVSAEAPNDTAERTPQQGLAALDVGEGLSATIFAWVKLGKPDFSMTVNGALAGLVAITAPCAFVTPTCALIIGVIANLHSKVVIQQINIQIRQDQLLADEMPDDAGHLVAIQFDDRVLNFNHSHKILLHNRNHSPVNSQKNLSNPARAH